MSLSINANSFLCPPFPDDHDYPTPSSSTPLVRPTIPYLTQPASTPDSSWSSSTSLVTSSWYYSSSAHGSPNTLSSPDSESPVSTRHKRERWSPRIVHPYARLEAKKSQQGLGIKRRKVWDHLLEKRIFSAEELSSIKAQDRRRVYVSSLEALVDSLHAQMLTHSLYPVPFERLEKMSGLHSKTTMAMIASVLQDMQEMRLKLLELERSTQDLRLRLGEQEPQKPTICCSVSKPYYLSDTSVGNRESW